ncbi:MAG: hypothetical protein K1Y01_02545 [Vicinamibacteria bacterium]|nr:hypothetical protein [Vicinamibacteria bacterium]
MKQRRARVLVAAMVLGSVATAADEPIRSVFITAGTLQVAAGDEKELRAKANDAYKTRRDAEKKLKEQFGKKREAWPPEKDDELYALEEAEAVAMAAWQYRKVDPKAVADAIKDLSRAAEGKGMQAGKKNHIALVSSAAEADVLVEILARRSESRGGAFTATDCWVLFSIGRGEKTAAARFAKIPADYRPKTSWRVNAYKIASPNAERPGFIFEGYNGGGSSFGCHGAAANGASHLIDRFIEDNHANLVAK